MLKKVMLLVVVMVGVAYAAGPLDDLRKMLLYLNDNWKATCLAAAQPGLKTLCSNYHSQVVNTIDKAFKDQ